jgi:hypothetical protein
VLTVTDEEKAMRRLLLFVGVALATMLASAQVRAEIDYPWCAMTSTGQSGKPSCVYATLEQCRAFLAGQSGSCVRNARIVVQEQDGAARVKR